MAEKNNFILYKDFKTTIDILTDEQAGKLIKAVFSYVNGRVDPNFTDGMLIIAFNVLKSQLERDLVKYKSIIERNQTNGAKGGRPKKDNPDVIEKPNKPSGLNNNPNNPSEPKKADRDSVSVRDSVSDSDNVSDLLSTFDVFWKEYPRKVGKDKCQAWFKSKKVSQELFNDIIQGLQKHKKHESWTKDSGKFIPYPMTWLNRGGWQDELDVKTETNKRWETVRELGGKF